MRAVRTKRTKQTHARHRRPRSFQLETLEPRQVMASCVELGNLVTLVDDQLNATKNQAADFWFENSLPLIGKQLKDVTSPLDTIRDDLPAAIGELESILADGGSYEEISEALEESLVTKLAGYDIASVDATCDDESLAITVDLSKTVELQRNFDIGIAPLPIFSLSSDAQIDVQLGLNGLTFTFGIDADTGVAFFDAPDGISLTASADVTGDFFDATVGLLAGTISIQKDPAFDHALEVTMTLDDDEGTPVISAGSHFDLIFTGGGADGFLASLPSVEATVGVDWYGPGQGDQPPEVTFEGVQVEFGGMMSKLLTPIVEHLGPVIDKIDAVFDILDTKIPVLDKIIDPDPTIMSVLSTTANLSGSKEYLAAVKFLEIAKTITNIAEMFESNNGHFVMDFGNLNLNDNVDLRGMGQASLDGLVNNTLPALLPSFFGNEYSLDAQLVQWVQDENMPPELAGAFSSIITALQDPIELQIPFLQNPAGSVFGLLLGQDVDLIRFDVAIHQQDGLHDGAEIPGFDLPGFSFTFGNYIQWDLDLGIGLDTRGVRRFLGSKLPGGDASQPYHFGDGFYVTRDTNLSLSAGLAADAGVNILGIAHGHIIGGVGGTIGVEPAPRGDVEGNKLYIRTDMGECLGTASGGISAFLDAWVGLGIQVPFSDKFIGGKKEFHLAKQDLFTFHGGCIPNPWVFDAEVFEPATTAQNIPEGDPDELDILSGDLWLNIGHRSDLRGYLKSVEDEVVEVTHLETVNGRDTLRVTFGGQSKDYTGINRIVAYGGSGADFIQIDGKVTANVELYGEDGPDTLVSATTGMSTLSGGDGDDSLEASVGDSTLDGDVGEDLLIGGAGKGTLRGGLGNDVLVGGAGNDFLEGNDGNDRLSGGDGTNDIRGGDGNDTLYGCGDESDELIVCSGQNEIHGDDGDDILFAGPNGDVLFGGNGNDEIHAGAGDDMIATYAQAAVEDLDSRNYVYWEFGDGNSTILNGGRTINTVSMFGSSAADVFEAGDGNKLPLGAAEFEIDVAAPGGKTVVMKNVSYLNIDGLDESDTITLNTITNPGAPYPLQEIGVNMAPAFRDDGEVDHIFVNGTAGEDNLTVDAEQVLLVVPESCAEEQGGGREGVPLFHGCVWGGVMTVTRFDEYKIYATNLADDLQVRTFADADPVTINAATGPTRIDTGSGDDTIQVNAATDGKPFGPGDVPIPADYLAELDIEAGSGLNELEVLETESELADEIYVTNNRVWSQLLPGVNYQATGGNFNQLRVGGGLFSDTVHVQSTSSQVKETVVSGYFQTVPGEQPEEDTIIVSSTGEIEAGDLLGIRNRLTFVGHDANQTMVHVSDRNAAAGNGFVSVVGDEVTGFAGPNDDAVLEAAAGGLLEMSLYGSDDPLMLQCFTVNSPELPLFVYTGGGDDEIEVLGTVINKDVTLYGEGGDDRVTVPGLLPIGGSVIVSGGAGDDVVNIDDESALGGKTYLLNDTSLQQTAAVIVFDATLEDLELFTSDLSDAVHVDAVPAATAVQIDQGGGLNVLYGPSVDSQWNITSVDGGTLNQTISFRSAQTLVGGGADDVFSVAQGGGSSTSVFGGSGTGFDTLDYSQRGTSVEFQILNANGHGTSTNVTSFDAFERLTGGTKKDTLRGFAGNPLWEVTGLNTGLYHGVTPAIEFQSVENLVGDNGPDQFLMQPAGALAGSIDGGGGVDTVDYSPRLLGVNVNLSSGKATGVAEGIVNFENVIGGAGDDYLWGNNANNSLTGGGGDDVLIGGGGVDQLDGKGGRDLLIGGDGADTLNGRGGEDILIGGTTTYDNSQASLQLIMNEWKRTDISYDRRVDHLRNGGGVNGTVRLTNATVLNDVAADLLFGQGDKDWFFGQPAEILDLAFGEQQN